MSQASKHVDWCLKKAQREIEQAKKEGTRPQHRGLLRVEPNIEEAEKHLAKANHDLKVANDLIKKGYTDWTVSAIFYTMYQCFLSIVAKFGYESENQTCTIALIEYLKEEGRIDIDPRFIEMLKYQEDGSEKISVVQMREEYTYGFDVDVKDKAKLNDLLQECKELIDVTKEIVYK